MSGTLRRHNSSGVMVLDPSPQPARTVSRTVSLVGSLTLGQPNNPPVPPAIPLKIEVPSTSLHRSDSNESCATTIPDSPLLSPRAFAITKGLKVRDFAYDTYYKHIVPKYKQMESQVESQTLHDKTQDASQHPAKDIAVATKSPVRGFSMDDLPVLCARPKKSLAEIMEEFPPMPNPPSFRSEANQAGSSQSSTFPRPPPLSTTVKGASKRKREDNPLVLPTTDPAPELSRSLKKQKTMGPPSLPRPPPLTRQPKRKL